MMIEEKYIEWENEKVHYSIAGNGFPVVFIHGFAEESSVWNAQGNFLQNDYKIILPDIPGSGKSPILKKENAGLEDYADCIYQIIIAESIERCIMIGHSMGGYISLAFAEKYPELLMAFGLFHSSAYKDDEDKIKTRKKAIEFMGEHGTGAFLKTSIPGLFYDPIKSKVGIDLLLKKGNNFTPGSLIQYYQAMMKRPDRTSVLKKMTVPVMFIMGEHDAAIPFKNSLEQSYLPAHSYIHILRQSGHMGMWEETEKSNLILAYFLHNHDLR